jgi:predicted dehydrogenase
MPDTLGIIVNGATGGIADRQHLSHALGPIIREGGLAVGDRRVVPELLFVGRSEDKLAATAARWGATRWTTDLDAALADPAFPVFFDAGHTGGRAGVVRRALEAGKDVYAEKPLVTDIAVGHELVALAEAKGAKHGVVEDKLFLPGIAKLRRLAKGGTFGTVTNFRLDFGYWIFSGHDLPCQRGSWNYRKAEGGGLVLDMYPHWRYVIEGVLGPIRRVVAKSWTAVPERRDEAGRPYAVDVEDSVATIVELESGAVGVVTSSWATRVRRDDLITFQIDGTGGSAVAGLHRCAVQPHGATPKVRFDANVDHGVDYRRDWLEVPDVTPFANGYRMGWEAFLRHVVADAPAAADFRAGLRDVALSLAVNASIAEDRWASLSEFTRDL